MNLQMRSEVGAPYSSNSQRARVISETWIQEEMYCPACSCANLNRKPHGTKVIDFECPDCAAGYQAKSTSAPIRTRVMDSAYQTMIDAIESNLAPNLLLLHYSRESWLVQNLLLIPRAWLTRSAIERRQPLGPKARRAGWVGCNILLDAIPGSGRISAVKGSSARPLSEVRGEWQRATFVQELPLPARGWLLDVWNCVEKLGTRDFSLANVYAFEPKLAKLHPGNANVKPKIRQQLQILRNRNQIRFLGGGRYQLAFE